MLEQSGETHSNWRETLLKALQHGHLTTVITFQGTQYMVTLQPYESGLPLGAHKRDICGVCGQIAILPLGGQGVRRWYHREAEHGNHAASPLYHHLVDDIWQLRGTAAPAANHVEQAQNHARCTICGEHIGYTGKQWVHMSGASYVHDAAVAEGVGPKITPAEPSTS